MGLIKSSEHCCIQTPGINIFINLFHHYYYTIFIFNGKKEQSNIDKCTRPPCPFHQPSKEELKTKSFIFIKFMSFDFRWVWHCPTSEFYCFNFTFRITSKKLFLQFESLKLYSTGFDSCRIQFL